MPKCLPCLGSVVIWYVHDWLPFCLRNSSESIELLAETTMWWLDRFMFTYKVFLWCMSFQVLRLVWFEFVCMHIFCCITDQLLCIHKASVSCQFSITLYKEIYICYCIKYTLYYFLSCNIVNVCEKQCQYISPECQVAWRSTDDTHTCSCWPSWWFLLLIYILFTSWNL